MSVTSSAEELQIAHRSAGTGPPELLLVHGWAGSGAYFDEIVASLDLERVRVTSLDLSGHGDSPGGDGDWSLDRIDAAIVAVADAVGAQRSVVLGFSMGGKFAQYFALRHPERVAGLILVAGTQAASMAMPPEVLTDWYGRGGNAEAMKSLIRSFLTGPVDEAALDRFCRDAARVPPAALQGTLQTTIESDFSAELGSLDVPTLVVAGGRDDFFTAELLRDTIASQIRGARMAIVDCGHEVGLERPRELAGIIEGFLAGIGST